MDKNCFDGGPFYFSNRRHVKSVEDRKNLLPPADLGHAN